ncbi:MAG TPA: SDR family NAD(P)-dependent oxidoreductase [Polyangiaceae bacterium]|nr:SDR family NAD(P)-dependent oxidoreductase [Polyangiaceae bacterium]
MSRERVLILGATSAIASEVAQIYAGRGARLHLVGRNPEKLSRVAARLSVSDATTEIADFEQLSRNEGVVDRAIATLDGLDTVLIAHGYLGDQLASERAFDEADHILRANFTSVVSLLIPLANHLEKVGGGRLAVITSVAGDRGRPRNYTYGAAKGALNVYLQGVRSRLFSAGVHVTTLKLGPVDTPMTTTHKKHLLFGKPPTVAAQIVAATDAGKSEAYVPAFWGAIMPIVKNTPEPLFQAMPFLSRR